MSYRYFKGKIPVTEAILIPDPQSPGAWLVVPTYDLSDVWKQGWENALQTARIDPVKDEDDLITAARRMTEAIENALLDISIGFAMSEDQLADMEARRGMRDIQKKLQNLENLQSSQSTKASGGQSPLASLGEDDPPLDG